MRVAARNREKFITTTILGVYGYSRSSMLTFLRSSSPMLVMIGSMFVPICIHFHVRRANSGKITPFQGGCPSFALSFVETPFTQWHEILSQNTKGSKLSCGRKLKSLSHLVSKRYLVVADRRTEERTNRQTE